MGFEGSNICRCQVQTGGNLQMPAAQLVPNGCCLLGPVASLNQPVGDTTQGGSDYRQRAIELGNLFYCIQNAVG